MAALFFPFFTQEAATLEPPKIKIMSTKFFKIFPREYRKIKTKYDLYFLSQMLEEIMNTYEGRDGVAIVSGILCHVLLSS